MASMNVQDPFGSIWGNTPPYAANFDLDVPGEFKRKGRW